MLHLGIVLGLLSAIGPISIDLYLPAFPAMAGELSASPDQVQLTLSVFFLALAVAQIPVGLFGDRYGRKLPLYLGLGLFVAASVACAATSGITQLILLRFVQGFGVCAGTAVSRAMIRDLASGHHAARLMANSFLIIGISPILAPLAGSFLMTVMPWRGLFLVLAAIGLFAILLVRFYLPESLPPSARLQKGASILPKYRALLTNRRFFASAFVAAFATTIPFSYVTAAPFVFSKIYGLDSMEYSLLLALNALCSIASTQFSPGLMKLWGPRMVLRSVGAVGVLLTIVLTLLLAAGVMNLIIFMIYSMLVFTLSGLMLTPAAVAALDTVKENVGAAAGTLGTIQLAIVASASALISVLPDTSVVPLAGVLGGVFVFSWALTSGEEELHPEEPHNQGESPNGDN
ncbi:multidrug effflux MFS transporter [Emcibacter nanhaiensis]|uniref:Bcr/CflA family efflux transporter n=2 Tax=Emcibacter nanhaiensis TaxID=1505037 RepID=A0A501PJ27_9PROT|nr:multidrug effflux MFS transporter [Emcibacter nanhaiensis]